MTFIKYFLPRSIIIFIVTFIVFSLIRTHIFKNYKKNSTGKREFILSLFIAYTTVLMFFLFIPNMVLSNAGLDLTSNYFDFVGDFKDRIASGIWGINIIPFKTITSYIKYSKPLHAAINILGNIIIFIPLGIMLPLLYTPLRKIKKILSLILTISFMVEFIQLFVGRAVDIDDIILNTIGGIIGYIIYKQFD